MCAGYLLFERLRAATSYHNFVLRFLRFHTSQLGDMGTIRYSRKSRYFVRIIPNKSQLQYIWWASILWILFYLATAEWFDFPKISMFTCHINENWTIEWHSQHNNNANDIYNDHSSMRYSERQWNLTISVIIFWFEYLFRMVFCISNLISEFN